MRQLVRLRTWVWLVTMGCAPAVLPDSLGAYDDDELAADELEPFVDPPDQAPAAPGDPAWGGPATPRADGQWAYTDPGELPTVRDADGHDLPLRHTHVDASLRGYFAHVVVTQTFQNDAEDPIEVVYAFPLPENSAVARMRIVVGDRVIESDVEEREAARRRYEDAKQEGHTAALLEQERPNIFTQSLANVPPGEDIDVEIEYLQTLSWDAGQYEFVFPMVIGPRFVPGSAIPTRSGLGVHPDTDLVPDASRISPPVVGEGMRRGDDFTIEVRAETGRAIDEWSVPTHEVQARTERGRLTLSLAEADEIPNRDFVLRYAASDEDPHALLLLGPSDGGGGYYALVVHPPRLDVDRLVGRREIVFVVDRSGSMSGEPLALAKQTVREALTHLRPVDTFNVIGFESGVQGLWAAPRPANASNLAAAMRFVSGLQAGGGTMMDSAVQAALSDDVAEGHNRYVMFLTDGFIGNEDQIFAGARDLVARIARTGQRARVFGVGIGSAPNRHLIAGLSRAGRGVPLEVGRREHGRRAVSAFTRYVDSAVVDNLRLGGGSLVLDGQHPADLGDLFASHPVVALGHYRGAADSPPHVSGTIEGRTVQIPVHVVRADASDAALDALWARAAVADLEPRLWAGPDPEAEKAITRLGLEHHIVTAFTSFIAVGRSRRVGDGAPDLIVEPTLVPAGVDGEMAGAVTYAAGISLAGTTAASRDYSQVVVESSARRSVHEFMEVGGVHGEWPNNPRLVVGTPSATDGGSTRGIRRAARKVREDLRRCYAASTVFDRQARHRLRVRVTFGADGPTISLIGSIGDEATDGCLRDALSDADWPSRPDGTVIDIPLHLSAH